MPMDKSGMHCAEHGGAVSESDKRWCCDVCAIQDHTPCKCGGNARSFGEALFSSTGCENCDEYVAGVALGVSTRLLWNRGYRGQLDAAPDFRE